MGRKMTPLKIALVENCDGARRINRLGVFKTACVIFLIAAPIAALAAVVMGPLPIVIITAVMLAILASMVRAGLSTPMEQLPKRI